MQSPFAGIENRPDLWMPVMARSPAPHRMVIYFTPRSSSSRLTEILSRTRRMGEANEIFNPEFAQKIAAAHHVSDPDSYIELLLRNQHTKGVFSCEITGPQLQATFPDERPFLRAFASAASFWLIRRDIVAQAVSLAKMVRTGLGHSTQAGPEDRAKAEAGFDYDAAEIRHWIRHLRGAEILCEDFFHRHLLTPLRLCYEDMVRLSPQAILSLIARHACLPVLPPEDVAKMVAEEPLRHAKLGTSRNAEFAARFRKTNGPWLARLEAARAPMLERIHAPHLEVPTVGELRARLAGEGFPSMLPGRPHGWRLKAAVQRLISSR